MVIELLFWLAQLLVISVRGRAVDQGSTAPSQNLAARLILQYCAFSSMHGLVYISLWRRKLVQLYWVLTFVGALSLGFYIVVSNFIVRMS